mmetsp:Transcript_85999/g.228014  ORF Transcript_85999/g.228014 Transcript_85999/m.228014 type:complete len:253 (-) Transcript_85999:132-890(-)
MGKKRKKPAGEDPGLVFDVAARQEFLLGFRKRKTARRKKAILEGIEAKRQDQIDVKRDLRNHIKDSWKQVQWADRHALKVIEAGSFGSRAKALMDREDGAGASGDGSSSEDGSGEPGALEDRPRAASTVAFEREEDDPFGGCEVTVDGRDLCLLGAASASASSRDSAASSTALVSRGAPGAQQIIIRDEAYWKRRAICARKEAAVKKKASAKRLAKWEVEQRRMKKKSSKAKKDKGKNKKPTAKARRKRKCK